MEEVRVAIVGLGHRGRFMGHMADYAFKFTKVVAACDIDPALWHETQWGKDKPMKECLPDATFYEDYETMLDNEKLDFVLVETGADVHADFCVKALNRNINVFSDIPSVANLKEAKMLWEAEQKSNARLMTGANPNEWGFVNALVELYEKGLLGEPYYMEAEYIHASFSAIMKERLTSHSPWRKTLPPIRYCTHSLGPLLRILRNEDLRYAICLGTGCHVNPQGLKDDMQAALFQTPSGVTIRLLRNGACRARIGHHSYRVFGTEGYFERIDSRGKTPPVCRFNSMKSIACNALTDLSVDMGIAEYEDNASAGGHGGADYALFDHMFKAFLEKKGEFPISLRDGLRMTLPGIYAAESAKLGGEKITMHYPWEAEFDEDIKRFG